MVPYFTGTNSDYTFNFLYIMENKKIVECRITPPKGLFEPDNLPKIFVKLEGETDEQYVLEFYPDEISFSPEEIIGKTIIEVHTLKFKKDKLYLQS
jgi:hypothetical protein